MRSAAAFFPFVGTESNKIWGRKIQKRAHQLRGQKKSIDKPGLQDVQPLCKSFRTQ
jgi:hypothetical protein